MAEGFDHLYTNTPRFPPMVKRGQPCIDLICAITVFVSDNKFHPKWRTRWSRRCRSVLACHFTPIHVTGLQYNTCGILKRRTPRKSLRKYGVVRSIL